MKTLTTLMTEMTNVFDYAEYVALCRAKNVCQMQWFEYANKVGMVNYATALYPDVPSLDAYYLTVKNVVEGIKTQVLAPVIVPSDCNCGGGKVR